MKSTSPQLVVDNNQPNFSWVDGLVLLTLFGVLWSVMHFGQGMLVAFNPASVPELDFSTSQIPYYAGRTLLRMWIAFGFSLFFAISLGYLAAKNSTARAVILPAALDFHELGQNFSATGLGVVQDGRLLGFQPQSRPALPFRADAVIGGDLHGLRLPVCSSTQS